MTRLGIVSDMHFEFRDRLEIEHVIDTCNKAECDKLIIAGDIWPNSEFVGWFLSEMKLPYFFVPGNHDYWYKPIVDDFHDEDGIVGACLWTNFDESPWIEQSSRYSLSDFSFVKEDNTRIISDKMKEMFYSQSKRIFQSPSEIVVTHFAPSMMSVHERFKGDPFNVYFCNSLEEEILDSNKKLWVHGHTHNSFDYKLGNTRIVCNPMGYPKERPDVRTYKVKYVEV